MMHLLTETGFGTCLLIVIGIAAAVVGAIEANK